MRGDRILVSGGVALALIAPVAPAGAASGLLDGNELLSRCSESAAANPVQWGVCLGYVLGIADALDRGATISGARACLSPDVTNGQLMDMVSQWLTRNPAKRHLNGATLTAAALQQAFPCKKSR